MSREARNKRGRRKTPLPGADSPCQGEMARRAKEGRDAGAKRLSGRSRQRQKNERPSANSHALPCFIVGADAHIGPAGCTFLQKSPANSQLPNGPTESSAPTSPLRAPCRGGRLCPPAEYTDFTKICGEFVTSQWADVGIGPYMVPANSYCAANLQDTPTNERISL